MKTLRIGDTGEAVLELSNKLVDLNLLNAPLAEYDNEFRRAIKVFQSYNIDSRGRPLDVDGVAGPLTQLAFDVDDASHIFDKPVPSNFLEIPESGGTKFGRAALQFAIDEMKADAREIGKNNQGEFVAKYHRLPVAMAAKKKWAWCAAFTSWCFSQAATKLHRDMPFKYTGGAQNILKQMKKINNMYDLSERIPEPGDIVVWKRGHLAWQGHAGIVYSCSDGILYVVEGNRGPYPSSVRVYDYVLNDMDSLLGFCRVPEE